MDAFDLYELEALVDILADSTDARADDLKDKVNEELDRRLA